MKKNVLFLDIDGTLYDYHRDEIPHSAIQALQEISETTEIVIATGRASYMLHSIEKIRNLIDHYVLINGQYIISQNQVIYENPLDKRTLQEIVKELDRLGLAYGFQGAHTEAISHIGDKVKATFQKLGLVLPNIDKDFYVHNNVYQMWCFATQDEILTIQNKFPTIDFIRWLDVGFDILGKGTSKGDGMVKLIDILSWHDKTIYAIGDGDNDYEMIKKAQIGIAMGNSTEKLKSVADYVTTDIDEDGLKKALKHFKLL